MDLAERHLFFLARVEHFQRVLTLRMREKVANIPLLINEMHS